MMLGSGMWLISLLFVLLKMLMCGEFFGLRFVCWVMKSRVFVSSGVLVLLFKRGGRLRFLSVGCDFGLILLGVI